MKPSTLIVIGGAAVAGYLLWRSYSSSSTPSASKECTSVASGEAKTAVAKFMASRQLLLNCKNRLASTAPAQGVQTAPPILVAPKPSNPLVGVVETQPAITKSSTTTTRLSSFSYTGRISA